MRLPTTAEITREARTCALEIARGIGAILVLGLLGLVIVVVWIAWALDEGRKILVDLYEMATEKETQ